MFDLSSPVSTNMPLLVDILRDFTLELAIKVGKALADLRECLREVVKDRDCCRELANTLMEDIEEINNVQERELNTLRSELGQMGPAPPGTDVKYA